MTNYKVSHPKYTAITEAQLIICTPKEKAHLFFKEYTHIIHTQAHCRPDTPLLNYLAKDQPTFQYPNRSLEFIKENAHNQNALLTTSDNRKKVYR